MRPLISKSSFQFASHCFCSINLVIRKTIWTHNGPWIISFPIFLQIRIPLLGLLTLSFENHMNTNYPMNPLLPNLSFTSHRHSFLVTAFVWNPQGNNLPHAPFTARSFLHFTSPQLFSNRFHLKPIGNKIFNAPFTPQSFLHFTLPLLVINLVHLKPTGKQITPCTIYFPIFHSLHIATEFY